METAKIYTYTILRSSTPAFIDKIPYCSSILESEAVVLQLCLTDMWMECQ